MDDATHAGVLAKTVLDHVRQEADNPARALLMVGTILRTLGEELDGANGLVFKARVAGLSYAQIGELIGLTKQAVHTRYSWMNEQVAEARATAAAVAAEAAERAEAEALERARLAAERAEAEAAQKVIDAEQRAALVESLHEFTAHLPPRPESEGARQFRERIERRKQRKAEESQALAEAGQDYVRRRAREWEELNAFRRDGEATPEPAE